jgi:hypothetical protein
VSGGSNVTYVSAPKPTVTTTTAQGDKVQTFNIRIVSDSKNNTIVSWDNNLPTYPEVVFGFTSQPADNLSSYNYDFTTGQLADLSAHHEVNLGQLENNRAYFVRLISRAQDGTDITSEMTYIPVPGKAADIVVGANGSANILATLGSIGTVGWFLFALLVLVILALIVAISIKRRDA